MRYDVRRDFDRATVPAQAAALWTPAGAAAPALTMVAESQNFVYRFKDASGAEFFLRLTPESRRHADNVEAELDFVNYLAEQRAHVAAPVRSQEGKLVHTMDAKPEPVHAAVFRAVSGEPVKWNTDADNKAILFERGKTLGKIHKLSQAYKPPGVERFHWYHDDLFINPWDYFPPDTPVGVKREYQNLVQFLLPRARTRENYGMVHGDFGSNNTLRKNGIAVAFDFDDCCFHWFLFDIGVAMQAGIMLPDEYRKKYLRVMLDGYETERKLGADERVEDAAMFCRLATFFRYVTLLRTTDLKNLDAKQREELDRRRQRVERPPAWY